MPCAPCPRRLVGVVLLAIAWSTVAAAQERDVTPVTDAMLQDPAPGDYCTVANQGVSLSNNRFWVDPDGFGCYGGAICGQDGVIFGRFSASRIAGTSRWQIDALPPWIDDGGGGDGGGSGGGVPTVRLSASPNPIDEGDPVTTRLSSALEAAVTVPLTLRAGTAEAGDYGALSGITVGAGSTTGTGTISTADDADRDDEAFRVALDSLPAVRAASRRAGTRGAASGRGWTRYGARSSSWRWAAGGRAGPAAGAALGVGLPGAGRGGDSRHRQPGLQGAVGVGVAALGGRGCRAGGC